MEHCLCQHATFLSNIKYRLLNCENITARSAVLSGLGEECTRKQRLLWKEEVIQPSETLLGKELCTGTLELCLCQHATFLSNIKYRLLTCENIPARNAVLSGLGEECTRKQRLLWKEEVISLQKHYLERNSAQGLWSSASASMPHFCQISSIAYSTVKTSLHAMLS